MQGHCWRRRDELISNILVWTPSHGRAKAGRSPWVYIQQLCEDTVCSPGDLPEAMNDREGRRERVKDICAGGTTIWWLFHIIVFIIYVSDFTFSPEDFKWFKFRLFLTLTIQNLLVFVNSYGLKLFLIENNLYIVTWFSNWSSGLIDGNHTSTTNPGQSGPGNNDNEEVLHTPQSLPPDTI